MFDDYFPNEKQNEKKQKKSLISWDDSGGEN